MVLRRANREISLQPVTKSTDATTPVATSALQIDNERKSISFHGCVLELSRTEFRLLKVLAENPGRVYSRDELMEQAWDYPDVSMDRTVDAHIKQLRAKLRAVAPNNEVILTRRGMGYSLKDSM
jgi:two-component system catabolic regulation response regulator CreB